MSDPRRGQGSDPYQPGWSAPTEPLGDRNRGNFDPAYAGQFSYPSYTPPPGPNDTQQLPPYWTQTQYQSPQDDGGAPPPPEPPGAPRWLWLLAGAAVLLVIGLVIALVIANGSNKQDTLVAPLTTPSGPPATEPTTRTTTPPQTTPRTTTRTPSPTTTTAPVVPPTTTTQVPTGEQTVLYSVTGEGRAINITYADTGGVMQMEFNVPLPWSKEVTMESASQKANVSVLTVGRQVTCSVTVDGTVLWQKSGNGLTICSPLG